MLKVEPRAPRVFPMVDGYLTIDGDTSVWPSDNQPWLDQGVLLQYRSHKGHVTTDALDAATGELIASASHSALIRDHLKGWVSG